MADNESGFRIVLKDQKVSPVTLTTANLGLILIPYFGARLARPGRAVRFFINKNLSKTAEVLGNGSVSTILEDVSLVPPPIISVDVDGTPIRNHILEVSLPYPKPKMELRRDAISEKSSWEWEVLVGVEVRDEKGCGVEADYVYTAVWDGDFRESPRRADISGRDVFEVCLPKGFRRAKVKVKLEKLDCEQELVIKEPLTPIPAMSLEQKLLWLSGALIFLLLIIGAIYFGQ